MNYCPLCPLCIYLGLDECLVLLKACRTEFRVAPKDTESGPEGLSRERRTPRLGGSLDRGWAERLEQAKMLSELRGGIHSQNLWPDYYVYYAELRLEIFAT